MARLVALDFPIVGRLRLASADQEDSMLTFRVDDMNCGGCTRSIANAVRAVDTTAQVQVDLARKHVRIQSAAGDEVLFRRAIAAAGFSAVPVVANPTARTNADACGCNNKCGCG